jgi:heme exporter protein C
MTKVRDQSVYILVIAAALVLGYNLYRIVLVLPDDAMQGPIYRIIYFHVPAAITAFTGFFVALVMSAWYLSSGSLRFDALAASVTEVSLIFAVINLVTGSIWAHVIWGVWWTWDARLTSMLVCVLIYSGYLLLRQGIDEPTRRARLSAALSIFGFADVIIVWKSIEWFRTNHPQPVLSVRTGGGHMDPAMERALFVNLVALLITAAALVIVRARQESMGREIDSLRRYSNSF